jgi:hypothetical protein
LVIRQWSFVIVLVLGLPFPAHGQEPKAAPDEKPARDPAPASVRFDIGKPDDALFHGPFEGFGVEWDPFYWNDNNRRRGTDEAGWKLITERLKTLRVPIVRMMFQVSTTACIWPTTARRS